MFTYTISTHIEVLNIFTSCLDGAFQQYSEIEMFCIFIDCN